MKSKKLEMKYFGFLPAKILTQSTTVLDIGCGSGRWSYYMARKVHFVDAVDPSKAIFSAAKLLSDCTNVRLSQAAVSDLPFEDGSFDFVMIVGVLHHIPDTHQAIKDCFRKVKSGGYIYLYLYYNLDNRGFVYKFIFFIINIVRKFISGLPEGLKKLVCDIIAIFVYFPLAKMSKFLNRLGLIRLSNAIPLSYYMNKSFFVMRNDALDRFGTSLEHRFSKEEIKVMLESVGAQDIVFDTSYPYWKVYAKKN